ncbi:alpha/beta hydrolase [Aureimonas populi]|uniref:Alpha/beta hydrolase n=1 Tax=Aureimonas populi TaxID=1701758 RepID=A0ABW5CM50_9HYPH|nr:alpha/beta-hydrolase family protein [Aureimonas populi]
MHEFYRKVRGAFSTPGLLLGTLFFAASLTPSLLPRTYLMQGVLGGASFATGYGIGVAARWLWAYLEIPLPSARADRIMKLTAGVICVVTVAVFAWRAAEWQNSVRSLMGLDAVETAYPLMVTTIAAAVFALLTALVSLFRRVHRFLSWRLNRHVPRRISKVVGLALTAILFWSVINGVFFETLLRVADSSFQELDQRIDPQMQQPADAMKTGSASSLIDWELLGLRGREFVTSGPTAEEIGRFFGSPALEPLRVYVGLNSRENAEERAALALEEMLRVGAFDRSILVVVVPTGTGWIDPAALDTLEYLHRGDVASVALQYSYLTSWLSLLVEPGYGGEAGRALFSKVYAHWTTLPAETRPRLYLHGLSLGAMNSELSSDLYDVIADPFHGALWSGPPFSSQRWRQFTAERQPDSPAWLPRFRDGSIVRFANQTSGLSDDGTVWGPMRIGYLQYASDPVTFFDPHSLYREPAWMRAPRGPDVSASLTWFPVVTMLQLALDMAVATTTPIGYGHVYAPEHYIDAWVAITQPPTLDTSTLARLKEFLADRF